MQAGFVLVFFLGAVFVAAKVFVFNQVELKLLDTVYEDICRLEKDRYVRHDELDDIPEPPPVPHSLQHLVSPSLPAQQKRQRILVEIADLHNKYRDNPGLYEMHIDMHPSDELHRLARLLDAERLQCMSAL